MEDSATARGGKRKRSRVEEERREAQVARDLADPRWKRIRVRHGSGGRKKWKSGVVIGGKRGKAATQGVSGSASLVLYEDGEERVEDLDAVEWEERGSDAAQARPSAPARSGVHTSIYRGVSWSKQNKKWQVQIRVGRKTKHIGYFAASDEIAAARASDAFVIAKKLNKPLNFPDNAAAKGHVVTSSTTSHFRGVCWIKSTKKWKVQIRDGGKPMHIGVFDDEVEAAHAYDAFVIANSIDAPRNFQGEK
jgi:hypothetical protein